MNSVNSYYYAAFLMRIEGDLSLTHKMVPLDILFFNIQRDYSSSLNIPPHTVTMYTNYSVQTFLSQTFLQ